MYKKYEINDDTLAIVSLSRKRTIVYEKGEDFIINDGAYDIINENCKNNGSSYLGRTEATRYLTGIAYKAPIVVEEGSTILFPTKSPKSNECVWINLNNVQKINKNRKNVRVYFSEDKYLDLKESYYIIENQYLKASLLNSVMLSKNLNKNKQY